MQKRCPDCGNRMLICGSKRPEDAFQYECIDTIRTPGVGCGKVIPEPLRPFLEGDRVVVFDYTIYKNDKTTPLDFTLRPATVVKWYGKIAQTYCQGDMILGPYESLIDVIFDHRPNEVSHGHFTDSVPHI